MADTGVRVLRIAIGIATSCALACARTPDLPPLLFEPANTGEGDGGQADASTLALPLPMDAAADAEMRCAAIREKAPVAQGVDVIFVVDSSPTMLQALQQVQANISSFIEEFAAAGQDIRVVMITAVDPAANSPVARDAAKYRFIQANVPAGMLYQTALDRFPDYQSFLRKTAAVQFVMVTSSDDQLPSTLFQTSMKALLGGRDFTQHAIASPDVNGFPCISESQAWNPLCVLPIPAICAAFAVGRAYNSLASDTGGDQLSVCKQDWGDVFATLKKSVTAAVPLPCNFLLPSTDDQKKMVDPQRVSMFYANGNDPEQEFPRAQDARQCADKLGWYYDDPYAPTTLTLCPRACQTVAAGGEVDIGFGCAPPLLL